MTTLTTVEQATLDGYIAEYLAEFAPVIDAERFTASLRLRILRFEREGCKPTDVLYGEKNTDFRIYFYNAATGYTVWATWKGEVYGTWSYGGGSNHNGKGDLRTTGSLRDIFNQMKED